MKRVVALITAVTVALGVLLSFAAPGGGQVTNNAPADSPSKPRLQLMSVSNWVGPNAVFRAEVNLADIPDASRTTFTLHQAVTNRYSLDRSTSGEEFGAALLRGEASLSGGTPRVATIGIPISDTWPAPDNGVVLTTSGVFPVEISAVSADGAELATIVTQLIRLPDPDSTIPPLAIGLIVEQREIPSIALDGGTFLAPGATDHLLASLRTLDEFPMVPLSTLPSASTLINLNLTRPDIDQAGFSSLRPTPTRQLLASTYAPITVGSWLSDGLVAETENQFSAGADTIGRLLGAVPDHRIAVLDPSIDSSALSLLHDRGTEAVIVPSDQLLPTNESSRTPATATGTTTGTAPAPTLAFDVRTTTGDRLHAIAADSAVTARLRAEPGTAGSPDPVVAGHNALADLALIALADNGAARGLAIVVPDSTSTATLRVLLGALADRDGASAGAPGSSLLSPVTLDDLFTITDVTTAYDANGATPSVRNLSSEEPTSLGSYPALLRSNRRSVNSALSMIPESPYLVGSAVHRSLTSGDRSLSDDQRNGVVVSADAALRAITDEIVMTPQQVVTLTSRSGKVPLSIENRLQVPAHVHVNLRSAKLDFPEGSEFDLVLAPGTTTRVDAQVTTRASGAFPLDVTVNTADGALPVTTARFTVRSTAISGIGLVISIGAGLFLLIWWIRHFRSSRRAAGLIGTTVSDVSDPDGTSPSTTAAGDYAPRDDQTPGDP
jgi:hypothetical protein